MAILGNDTIYGDDGEDSLYGDDGDDTLHIDGNDKTIDGGAGYDTLIVQSDVGVSLDEGSSSSSGSQYTYYPYYPSYPSYPYYPIYLTPRPSRILSASSAERATIRCP